MNIFLRFAESIDCFVFSSYYCRMAMANSHFKTKLGYLQNVFEEEINEAKKKWAGKTFAKITNRLE